MKRDYLVLVLFLISLFLFRLWWEERGTVSPEDSPEKLPIEEVSFKHYPLLGRKIPLNQCDPSSLEAVPGIGPVLAEKIVAYRKERGKFTSLGELRNIPGMGEKTLEKIRPYVSVE